MLDPFNPMLNNDDLINALNKDLWEKVENTSEREKKEMVRYIYLRDGRQSSGLFSKESVYHFWLSLSQPFF